MRWFLSIFLAIGISQYPLSAQENGTLPTTVVTSLEPIETVQPTVETVEVERNASPEVPMEEMVEGLRLETPLQDSTRAISVIDVEADSLGRPLLNLNEVLQRVPGVHVQNANNFAQDTRLSIRGFGARSSFGLRGVRLFVEGVPLTLTDGQSFVDALDLPLADRIEVIRGASSAQYGNATGGVVDIRLRAPSQEPFFESEFVAGSFGLHRERLSSGGSLGSLGFDLGYNHTKLDGWRENAASRSSILTFRSVSEVTEDQTLSFFVSVSDAPWAGDPGGLTRQEVEENRRFSAPNNRRFSAGETLSDATLGTTWKTNLSPGTSLQISAFHHEREFQNSLPFRFGGQVEFDRVFSGAKWIFEQEMGGLTWLAGMEGQWQSDDRQRFLNLSGERGRLTLDQEENVRNQGVFGQIDWMISERTKLAAGLRHDTLAFSVEDQFLQNGDASAVRRFHNTSWNVGLSHRVSEEASLFTSLSTSFESPTTTELANPVGGGFNSQLSPAEALSAELGIRGQSSDGSFDYEAVAFWIENNGEIIPFELDAFPGRRFFASAGVTKRQGFELSLEKAFPHDLFISAQGSFGQYQFENDGGLAGGVTNGKSLPGIPGATAFLECGYRPEKGCYALFDLQFTGGIFADNENTVSVDSFTAVGARIGCKWESGGWEIHPWVGVNNLFDATYNDNVRINAAFGRFFEPAPGINYHTGILVKREF